MLTLVVLSECFPLNGGIGPIIPMAGSMGGNRYGYNNQNGYQNGAMGGSSSLGDTGSSNFNRGGYSSFKQGGYENFDNQRNRHHHKNAYQSGGRGGSFNNGFGQNGYSGGMMG